MDDLSTNAEKTKVKLKNSVEQVHFFRDRVSEQSNQLVETDAYSSSYRDRFVFFESDFPTALAEIERLTTQCIVDKDLPDCVHTALATHNTASQQCFVANPKDLEGLLAGEAAINTEVQKFVEDKQTIITWSQESLDITLKGVRYLDCGCVRLLVCKKSLK